MRPVPPSDEDDIIMSHPMDSSKKLSLDFESLRSNRYHFNSEWAVQPLDSTDVERLKFNTPEIESFLQPMEDQEKSKLERKRLRNRIAASKCRRRKLEKISKLEDKVNAVRNDNKELLMAVNQWKQTLLRLKNDVVDHNRHGCCLSLN